MNMDRITRQVLDHVSNQKSKNKLMKYVKYLRKEVDINGTGTNKYRIKCGPNKGKVLNAPK